ncbi:RICIN domain-containing protein [Aquimarina sp. ERC-38]|uniref:RICIN domain-containing protein n=1 Tax=Aquimarina sp. ERC-38 TaxID=2949996 RepID=UPI002245C974|nr:RICIN domain-containing protein [Aquimarina sp. ERC-38]UZO81624.1 RICIN domain-containing protein [Aquimarina sp. ERC-38]
MKKISISKVVFQKFLWCAAVIFSASLSARDIYVAKNGNDSNPGTQSKPYKTIAKASSVAKSGDVVIISGGTYEEVLQPVRSGSPGQPITYRAKTGEKVIITAMQAINNWKVDKGAIYKAEVNWDLGQDNMVLHKNTLMDLARWPNNIPQNVFKRDYLPACNRGSAGGGKTWLNYNGSQSNGHAKSIPYASKWKNGGSIHFFGGAGFIAWTDYITSATSNRVNFKLKRNQDWIQSRHHPGYTGHGIKKGEFFLQGIKEALDYKNEWFYDKNKKTLFVQIEGGRKPANNSISFRRRTQTIKLDKNYIHIEGLAVFGGSIDITGNNNKLFKVSSFYGNHTLGVINGFDSRRQSVLITGSNNVIERCEIAWGAGNGVYDQGTDSRVLNSYIHDFNYLGNYDCVLNTRSAKRGKYRNNTLARAGKDIIQAYVDGGEFAYNDISQNNFVADDGGLLYTTDVRAAKSSIHHNTFHDSKARVGRFKATGIYLDNDSKNWDVHHNVVWNTQWTNIQINWNGTNLNIFNNTFVKGSATMGAWHKEGTKFSNVKVWNNITDREAKDQAGNQESESTWEPQSNKQNNLVNKESFTNFNNNNFTLKKGAKAIDFGRVISGFTNGFKGKKPDAGAYEFGVPPFKTGINWNPKQGPAGLGCYGLPGESCNKGKEQKDTITFANAPTTIESKKSYEVAIKYTAKAKREIVAEFWSSTGYLGQAMVQVNPGSGTVKLQINLPKAPTAGTGYIYKAHIRPLNTSWQDALVRDQINDVTVTKVGSQIIANGTYFITSTLNSQRLTSNAKEKHNVRMVNPGSFDNQKWVFTHVGSNFYSIRNKASNRYLEVPFANCTNGSNVATWTDAKGQHKQWKVVRRGNQSFSIQPKHCLSKGLDRKEGSLNSNAQVWTYSVDNANQNWKIIKAGNKDSSVLDADIPAFIVSPNPVSNTLYLHHINEESKVVKISDLTGKVVLQQSVDKIDNNHTSINVSELVSGIYFISIGNHTSPVKFIKN